MKRVLILSLVAFLTANLSGQATETLSYQALIQDRSNVVIPSSPIGMRVSILEGSETGDAVYVETHALESDENGYVTFELGGGKPVTGNFSDVVLSSGAYFLKAECDPAGGTNYTTTVGASHLKREIFSEERIHFVGEYYGGGVIFHVEEGGKHGLITKTIDKSAWHLGTYTEEYTERDGIATSKFNKKRIQAISNSGAYDAQTFAMNEEEKLSDWFLPTKYDLDKMYINRSVLGGFSEFSKGWKSPETSSLNAWYRSFVTGLSFTNGRDENDYIRIIRKF